MHKDRGGHTGCFSTTLNSREWFKLCKVWFLQQPGELQLQGLGFARFPFSAHIPMSLKFHSSLRLGHYSNQGDVCWSPYPKLSLALYLYATSLFLIEHLATWSCIICMTQVMYLRTAWSRISTPVLVGVSAAHPLPNPRAWSSVRHIWHAQKHLFERIGSHAQPIWFSPMWLGVRSHNPLWNGWWDLGLRWSLGCRALSLKTRGVGHSPELLIQLPVCLLIIHFLVQYLFSATT